MKNISVPALIITGGANDEGVLSSVEVYIPSTNKSCTLKSLPEVRRSHTQDQVTACGGFDKDGLPIVTCKTFASRVFATTNKSQLMDWRVAHSSWRSPSGLVLIGGFPGESITDVLGLEKTKTTEIIRSSGVSTVGFELKYTAW